MPILTKLTPTKQGRMALFFDGEFTFSVDLETLTKEALIKGKEFSTEELRQLWKETEYQKAKERAFRLLGFKSYTRKMLIQRLEREEFSPETAECVLDRLEELGLIDDLDYAVRCSRDLVHLKKYSRSRVRQELRSRGVEEADIEEALEQLEPDDPCSQIELVLRKKYWKGLSEEKGRRRAVNGLMRLGYSFGDIRQVINDLSDQWSDVADSEE